MQGNVKSTKVLLVSAAIAGLFAAAQAGADQSKAADSMEPGKGQVKCYGVNGCKGKGECGSKKNKTSCAGSNSCKGKGWKKMSAEACKAKGGKTTES